MIKLRRSEGFSLVELMIVVAIIAILAAIAIPSFMRFSMKSKTSEATLNLGGIRTSEESYRAENDEYLTCTASPAGGGTDSTPDAWADAGTGFTAVGFAPDGQVRYIYEVAVVAATKATKFVATAKGDLDDDDVECVYTVDRTAATYPKAVKSGDDF